MITIYGKNGGTTKNFLKSYQIGAEEIEFEFTDGSTLRVPEPSPKLINYMRSRMVDLSKLKNSEVYIATGAINVLDPEFEKLKEKTAAMDRLQSTSKAPTNTVETVTAKVLKKPVQA